MSTYYYWNLEALGVPTTSDPDSVEIGSLRRLNMSVSEVLACCRRYAEEAIVIDEYGKTYTGEEFARVLTGVERYGELEGGEQNDES